MYILIHVSTLLLSVVIKIYPARWPLIDCEGVYSHGSINSDPARGMKSIPIYYMIYELHYFNRREGGKCGSQQEEGKQPRGRAGGDVLAPKAGARTWGGLGEAGPRGFGSQNTLTSGQRRARPEKHLRNVRLWDARLQPSTEKNTVAALFLSFPPVEQDLELLLNHPEQERMLMDVF